MTTQDRAILVVDLAFGDCGKGTIVDYLVRRDESQIVVRFNGGPQAGHNVVTPDGRHHTFSQFGSGTFLPGVQSILSRFVLIEPYAMLNEATHLAEVGVPDALGRLIIDARCPVITPAHQAANRLREIARGQQAHGTCGLGIGETMQDLLERPETIFRAGDLGNRNKAARILRETVSRKAGELGAVLRAVHDLPRAQASLDVLLNASWIEVALDHYAQIADRATILGPSEINCVLLKAKTMVFEGAQGVLLDEWFGFHPHATWSTTTFANADVILNESGFTGKRTRLGVLRSYFTRHGAGPLVTDDPAMRARLPEPHNEDSGWQGKFRVGVFDAVAARYALEVCGRVDGLAVTHLDQLEKLPRLICTGYKVSPNLASPADGWGLDRGVVRSIPAAQTIDLSRQERFTQALRSCQPVYQPWPDDGREGFLRAIQQQLGVPIAMTSDGPTAEHKREISLTISPPHENSRRRWGGSRREGTTCPA
jgi:adenylosuccinate synthase